MPNVNRRSFLSLTGVAGAAVAASPLLAACGGSSPAASKGTGASTLTGLAAALPKYIPLSGGPTPDIPSVAGAAGAVTDPGFLSYPASPVATVTGTPGKGGSYTAVTPMWGSIPPDGNAYYQAVNKALGTNITVKPADGNNYDKVIPTVIAGNDLPSWIQLPTWWNNSFNTGSLAAAKFADLTPYLSGDNIKAYPNLAAIPTPGWISGAWGNKIYGIPSFTTGQSFSSALFYRKDVFDAKGIKASDVKKADDLMALGKELTSAANGVWAFDVIWLMVQQIFNVPPNNGGYALVNGKLVSAYEVPQMLDALDFAYKLAKSGYVHPDGLADKTGEGKQRFYSGKTLITSDGTGAWNGPDYTAGSAANPAYVRGAFQLFAHDGSTPTIPLSVGGGSSIVSYLNKSLSTDQIKELLAVANFLAAPYGSKEYTLIKFGVEGTHYTMSGGVPTLTDQGKKEAAQDTYTFLACAPQTQFNTGQNAITQAYCAWSADAVKYAYKPVFYGMNVTVPTQFKTANAAQEINDTIKAVTYGQKTVSDFQAVLSSWKSSGGDQLVAWYKTNVFDKYGSGQA
jgi:putative aldouronate transport system substrate-binding protein